MVQFDPASFKDPAGRVFFPEGDENWVGRTLTTDAVAHYVAADRAGLLGALASDGLIVEGSLEPARALGLGGDLGDCDVLRQRRISFVSYAYEWSFDMLRDAALTTLAIMDRALAKGFILKDANTFNILFD